MRLGPWRICCTAGPRGGDALGRVFGDVPAAAQRQLAMPRLARVAQPHESRWPKAALTRLSRVFAHKPLKSGLLRITLTSLVRGAAL